MSSRRGVLCLVWASGLAFACGRSDFQQRQVADGGVGSDGPRDARDARADGSSDAEGPGDGPGDAGCGREECEREVVVDTRSGYSCATTGGRVWCWGANGFGQLGDGTTEARLTPVEVVGIDDAITVSCGAGHACAIRAGGSVYCWGSDALGGLGTGEHRPERVAEFVTLPLPGPASALSAGTCALVEGQVYCWGPVSAGTELGEVCDDGMLLFRVRAPQAMCGLEGSSFAGTGHSACVIDAAGEVACRGDNSCAELGDGTLANRNCARSNGLQATRLSRRCALDGAGQMWCWGQFPDGSLQAEPVRIEGFANARSLATLPSIRCAIDGAGTVRCMGHNEDGQVGVPGPEPVTAPVQVAGLPPARTVATSGSHTCVVTDPGDVWCWGANASGQLGDGTTESRAVPVRVAIP